jgi:hypothetical protein
MTWCLRGRPVARSVVPTGWPGRSIDRPCGDQRVPTRCCEPSRSRVGPPVGGDASRSGVRPSLFGGVDAQLTGPDPSAGTTYSAQFGDFPLQVCGRGSGWQCSSRCRSGWPTAASTPGFYFGSKAEVFRTLVNGVMETGLCVPHAPAAPRTNGRIPSVAEACSSPGRTPTTTSPPIGAGESQVVNPRGRDDRSSAAPIGRLLIRLSGRDV